MQYAGSQNAQGASGTVQSTPMQYGHGEVTSQTAQPPNASTTSILRNYRKKDNSAEKLQNADACSPGETQGPVARVAPHAYYPKPNADGFRYQHYPDFGMQASQIAAPPVKYSEIIEPMQNLDHHLTHLVPKAKEKSYLEMSCSQPHMKGYDYSLGMRPVNSMYKQQFPINAAMPHPGYFASNEKGHQQFVQKEAAANANGVAGANHGGYMMNYNKMQQYQGRYGPPGRDSNDFLSNLNKIAPDMAQDILNDQHLREQQFPVYLQDQNRLYAQPHPRMYQRTSPIHPNAGFNQRTVGYNHQYPLNTRGFQENYRFYQNPVNLKFQQFEQVQGNPFQNRISPNFNHCPQMEYQHSYPGRNVHFRQDFLPMQQQHPKNFLESNPEIPEIVPEGANPPSKSLKSYLENWNEENFLEDADGHENADGAKPAKENTLYVLEAMEIPSENIPQYIHLQPIEKLPPNIQRFYPEGEGLKVQRVENNSACKLLQNIAINSQLKHSYDDRLVRNNDHHHHHPVLHIPDDVPSKSLPILVQDDDNNSADQCAADASRIKANLAKAAGGFEDCALSERPRGFGFEAQRETNRNVAETRENQSQVKERDETAGSPGRLEASLLDKNASVGSGRSPQIEEKCSTNTTHNSWREIGSSDVMERNDEIECNLNRESNSSESNNEVVLQRRDEKSKGIEYGSEQNQVSSNGDENLIAEVENFKSCGVPKEGGLTPNFDVEEEISNGSERKQLEMSLNNNKNPTTVPNKKSTDCKEHEKLFQQKKNENSCNSNKIQGNIHKDSFNTCILNQNYTIDDDVEELRIPKGPPFTSTFESNGKTKQAEEKTKNENIHSTSETSDSQIKETYPTEDDSITDPKKPFKHIRITDPIRKNYNYLSTSTCSARNEERYAEEAPFESTPILCLGDDFRPQLCDEKRRDEMGEERNVARVFNDVSPLLPSKGDEFGTEEGAIAVDESKITNQDIENLEKLAAEARQFPGDESDTDGNYSSESDDTRSSLDDETFENEPTDRNVAPKGEEHETEERVCDDVENYKEVKLEGPIRFDNSSRVAVSDGVTHKCDFSVKEETKNNAGKKKRRFSEDFDDLSSDVYESCLLSTENKILIRKTGNVSKKSDENKLKKTPSTSRDGEESCGSNWEEGAREEIHSPLAIRNIEMENIQAKRNDTENTEIVKVHTERREIILEGNEESFSEKSNNELSDIKNNLGKGNSGDADTTKEDVKQDSETEEEHHNFNIREFGVVPENIDRMEVEADDNNRDLFEKGISSETEGNGEKSTTPNDHNILKRYERADQRISHQEEKEDEEMKKEDEEMKNENFEIRTNAEVESNYEVQTIASLSTEGESQQQQGEMSDAKTGIERKEQRDVEEKEGHGKSQEDLEGGSEHSGESQEAGGKTIVSTENKTTYSENQQRVEINGAQVGIKREREQDKEEDRASQSHQESFNCESSNRRGADDKETTVLMRNEESCDEIKGADGEMISLTDSEGSYDEIRQREETVNAEVEVKQERARRKHFKGESKSSDRREAILATESEGRYGKNEQGGKIDVEQEGKRNAEEETEPQSPRETFEDRVNTSDRRAVLLTEDKGSYSESHQVRGERDPKGKSAVEKNSKDGEESCSNRREADGERILLLTESVGRRDENQQQVRMKDTQIDVEREEEWNAKENFGGSNQRAADEATSSTVESRVRHDINPEKYERELLHIEDVGGSSLEVHLIPEEMVGDELVETDPLNNDVESSVESVRTVENEETSSEGDEVFETIETTDHKVDEYKTMALFDSVVEETFPDPDRKEEHGEMLPKEGTVTCTAPLENTETPEDEITIEQEDLISTEETVSLNVTEPNYNVNEDVTEELSNEETYAERIETVLDTEKSATDGEHQTEEDVSTKPFENDVVDETMKSIGEDSADDESIILEISKELIHINVTMNEMGEKVISITPLTKVRVVANQEILPEEDGCSAQCKGESMQVEGSSMEPAESGDPSVDIDNETLNNSMDHFDDAVCRSVDVINGERSVNFYKEPLNSEEGFEEKVLEGNYPIEFNNEPLNSEESFEEKVLEGNYPMEFNKEPLNSEEGFEEKVLEGNYPIDCLDGNIEQSTDTNEEGSIEIDSTSFEIPGRHFGKNRDFGENIGQSVIVPNEERSTDLEDNPIVQSVGSEKEDQANCEETAVVQDATTNEKELPKNNLQCHFDFIESLGRQSRDFKRCADEIKEMPTELEDARQTVVTLDGTEDDDSVEVIVNPSFGGDEENSIEIENESIDLEENSDGASGETELRPAELEDNPVDCFKEAISESVEIDDEASAEIVDELVDLEGTEFENGPNIERGGVAIEELEESAVENVNINEQDALEVESQSMDPEGATNRDVDINENVINAAGVDITIAVEPAVAGGDDASGKENDCPPELTAEGQSGLRDGQRASPANAGNESMPVLEPMVAQSDDRAFKLEEHPEIEEESKSIAIPAGKGSEKKLMRKGSNNKAEKRFVVKKSIARKKNEQVQGKKVKKRLGKSEKKGLKLERNLLRSQIVKKTKKDLVGKPSARTGLDSKQNMLSYRIPKREMSGQNEAGPSKLKQFRRIKVLDCDDDSAIGGDCDQIIHKHKEINKRTIEIGLHEQKLINTQCEVSKIKNRKEGSIERIEKNESDAAKKTESALKKKVQFNLEAARTELKQPVKEVTQEIVKSCLKSPVPPRKHYLDPLKRSLSDNNRAKPVVLEDKKRRLSLEEYNIRKKRHASDRIEQKQSCGGFTEPADGLDFESAKMQEEIEEEVLRNLSSPGADNNRSGLGEQTEGVVEPQPQSRVVPASSFESDSEDAADNPYKQSSTEKNITFVDKSVVEEKINSLEQFLPKVAAHRNTSEGISRRIDDLFAGGPVYEQRNYDRALLSRFLSNGRLTSDELSKLREIVLRRTARSRKTVNIDFDDFNYNRRSPPAVPHSKTKAELKLFEDDFDLTDKRTRWCAGEGCSGFGSGKAGGLRGSRDPGDASNNVPCGTDEADFRKAKQNNGIVCKSPQVIQSKSNVDVDEGTSKSRQIETQFEQHKRPGLGPWSAKRNRKDTDRLSEDVEEYYQSGYRETTKTYESATKYYYTKQKDVMYSRGGSGSNKSCALARQSTFNNSIKRFLLNDALDKQENFQIINRQKEDVRSSEATTTPSVETMNLTTTKQHIIYPQSIESKDIPKVENVNRENYEESKKIEGGNKNTPDSILNVQRLKSVVTITGKPSPPFQRTTSGISENGEASDCTAEKKTESRTGTENEHRTYFDSSGFDVTKTSAHVRKYYPEGYQTNIFHQRAGERRESKEKNCNSTQTIVRKFEGEVSISNEALDKQEKDQNKGQERCYKENVETNITQLSADVRRYYPEGYQTNIFHQRAEERRENKEKNCNNTETIVRKFEGDISVSNEALDEQETDQNKRQARCYKKENVETNITQLSADVRRYYPEGYQTNIFHQRAEKHRESKKKNCNSTQTIVRKSEGDVSVSNEVLDEQEKDQNKGQERCYKENVETNITQLSTDVRRYYPEGYQTNIFHQHAEERRENKEINCNNTQTIVRKFEGDIFGSNEALDEQENDQNKGQERCYKENVETNITQLSADVRRYYPEGYQTNTFHQRAEEHRKSKEKNCNNTQTIVTKFEGDISVSNEALDEQENDQNKGQERCYKENVETNITQLSADVRRYYPEGYQTNIFHHRAEERRESKEKNCNNTQIIVRKFDGDVSVSNEALDEQENDQNKGLQRCYKGNVETTITQLSADVRRYYPEGYQRNIFHQRAEERRESKEKKCNSTQTIMRKFEGDVSVSNETLDEQEKDQNKGQRRCYKENVETNITQLFKTPNANIEDVHEEIQSNNSSENLLKTNVNISIEHKNIECRDKVKDKLKTISPTDENKLEQQQIHTDSNENADRQDLKQAANALESTTALNKTENVSSQDLTTHRLIKPNQNETDRPQPNSETEIAPPGDELRPRQQPAAMTQPQKLAKVNAIIQIYRRALQSPNIGGKVRELEELIDRVTQGNLRQIQRAIGPPAGPNVYEIERGRDEEMKLHLRKVPGARRKRKRFRNLYANDSEDEQQQPGEKQQKYDCSIVGRASPDRGLPRLVIKLKRNECREGPYPYVRLPRLPLLEDMVRRRRRSVLLT